MNLSNLARCVAAFALVVGASGCELHPGSSESWLADSGRSRASAAMPNDCRAVVAQSTQKACKPIQTIVGIN